MSLLRNKWVIRLVSFILVLAGWQIIGSTVNPLFLSTPMEIVLAFPGTFAGTGSYNIFNATYVTLVDMGVGFLLSSVVGIAIGILMGTSRAADVGLNPYVNAFYVTPRIALIPLIIIWFGVGDTGIIATVFLSAVFPVLINTYSGMKNISKSLIDAANVFEVKGVRRFKQVIFPAALPFIMTGLRLGLASSLIGVIVAQLVLSLEGLGYLVTAYGDYYDTPHLMDTLIVLMLIGASLTSLIQYAERRIAYWKETERAYK